MSGIHSNSSHQKLNTPDISFSLIHTNQNNTLFLLFLFSLFMVIRPQSSILKYIHSFLPFHLLLSQNKNRKQKTTQTSVGMETSSMLVVFFISFLALLFQLSHSTTMVVDGVSQWKNPTVYVGDAIIFRHKNHYNLYIFQNREAFNLCNFTQASLLTKPNSTSYTWHPSRTGFFYFSFNNGSSPKACQQAEKLAIKVEVPAKPQENWATSPALPPRAAPSPTSGGTETSSPAYPWPFRPHEAASPSAEPSASPSETLVPDKSGGIPFINSNPAVPLPTGEVDSATIRPVPTSSGHGGLLQVEVGLLAAQMSVVCMVVLLGL